MTDKQRIEYLESRVKELDSALRSVIKTLEFQHEIIKSQMMLNEEEGVFIFELEGVSSPMIYTNTTLNFDGTIN